MDIDGQTYTSDLIIYPEKVDPSWWRKDGHRLASSDLKAIFAAAPGVLVIGTGYSGLMNVPNEVRKEILEKKIELYVEKSERAAEIFNSIQAKKRTVAAFHLTC
jgi:hypothetical protein